MELFIQVKDGAPIDHPIFGDNFREAFPDLDVENLPSGFAKFVRVETPVLSVYEVYEGVTYERDGDIFTDVHHVRPMTDAERIALQEQVKAQWSARGFKSWLFDEATCSFNPPTPYPADGKRYRWDEPTISWIEVTTTE